MKPAKNAETTLPRQEGKPMEVKPLLSRLMQIRHAMTAAVNKWWSAAMSGQSVHKLKTIASEKPVKPISPDAVWKTTAQRAVNLTSAKVPKGIPARRRLALKGTEGMQEKAENIPVRGHILLQAISSQVHHNAPGQLQAPGHPQTGHHVSRLRQAVPRQTEGQPHSHRGPTGAGQAIHHPAAGLQAQQPVLQEPAGQQGARLHPPAAAPRQGRAA